MGCCQKCDKVHLTAMQYGKMQNNVTKGEKCGRPLTMITGWQ